MIITALPSAPLPTDNTATFNSKAFALVAALNTFVTEANALGVDANADAAAALASQIAAGLSEDAAISAANFKGAWSGLTGALAIPASVSHLGKAWILTESVANVTTEVPGTSAKWLAVSANFDSPGPIGDVTPAAGTFTDVTVNGSLTIDGSAISPQTGFKNRIINGSFGINQRGVSGTVTLAAGVYGHDRWKAGASGCTYTFATVENVTTLTISAGSLIQVIEGLNLQTGTYTLSWTGTAQGKIGAGSYGASGITGAAVGGTNLNIEFNTGTVSLVRHEKGSVDTPFEFRSIGQELALCQRYFQTANVIVPPSTGTSANYFLKVSMRSSPTLAGGGAGFTNTYINSEAFAMSQTTASQQVLTMSAEL